MSAYMEVLFEELQGKGGNLGVITLNRPAALNSLNNAMIHAMYEQLTIWESARHIKAVIIRAAPGRAFCAGGDLRLTYERMKTQDPAMTDFFRDEYQLNRKIFHYSKPYIALLDGITMGGGVGISIHGSHRVATEKLLFAMPETGIGFFPDVGGSYFLPRLPGRIGYYLGLTGARISCDTAVQVGIATQKIAEDALSLIIDELAQQPFTSDAKSTVSKILEQYSIPVNKPTQLIEEQHAIDKCFKANTIEEIVLALKQDEHSICNEAEGILAKKSPTSLKVTLRALQEGVHHSFDACMKQEYRLVSHFLQSHDFAEGIRAVIIDKDQLPIWNPATLSGVTASEIEKYFAPV